jgi:hypothetical protein
MLHVTFPPPAMPAPRDASRRPRALQRAQPSADVRAPGLDAGVPCVADPSDRGSESHH